MNRSLILGVLLAGLCSRVWGQTELITNGGFEVDLNGWLQVNANASASTNAVHSGATSLALTTVAGSEEVFQNFTVPPTTVQALLSYYYSIFSVDASGAQHAAFSVWLADSTGKLLALADSKSNTNWDRIEGTFHQKSLDLTPYLRTNGGDLQIRFDVVGNSPGGTVFYLDDVSVLAVDAADRGPNDYFTNADLLLGPSATMTATNAYATKEPGEPNHAGNPGGHSLWWRWTAPGTGRVTLTTDGSDFDTLLAAYTGTGVNNLTLVAANDDGNGGRNMTGKISFAVTPGTEYKIAVDGKDGATGMIVLALSFAPDTTGPTVTFTSPGAGATVTNAQVTVQGTAKDSFGVAWVEYRLENANGTNDYQRAQGTNRWTATVTNLLSGVNTVRVRAYDTSTNVSAAVARAFYYDIFAPAKGTYAGLLATNSPGSTNVGFFTATVASKGKLSARLLLGGRSYSFAGQFGFDTTFSKAILRPGTTPLNVQLMVGLAGEDAIVGAVSDGTWTVPLRANRAIYSRTSPAPQGAKKYTLVMQNDDENANQPPGYGFGAVSIDGAGNVNFTGTLGDGARVSQRTFLSKAGEWPLYLSLAAGKEVMAGWLVFTNTVESDFNGTVSWFKQPQRAKLYPGGFLFTNGVAVVGSRYAYTNGVPVLDLPSGGRVWLQAGNLSTDLTAFFSLDNHNKLLGTNKLNLTLSTATGTFKGTMPPPGTGKPIAISGALLQKQNGGFGCFLGTNQTGRVTLGQEGSPP